MANEHTGLVLWITVIVLPLLALLIPQANRMQERYDARQKEKRSELEDAEAEHEKLYRKHIILRESFERLRNDVLRVLDGAITRLDTGGETSRVVKLLEDLKAKIEQFQLPPLDE